MYAVLPIIRLVNQIGYVLIAALGSTFVVRGRLSVGSIQALFQYVNMASEPLTEAAFVLNSLQAAIASSERVFELLAAEEEQEENQRPKKIKKTTRTYCL